MQWEEGSIRFIRAWLINGSIMTAAVLCSLLMVEGTLRAIHYTYTPLRIQVINQSSEWRDYFKFWDEQAGVGNQEFVYDPFLIWRPRKGGLFANDQGYRGEKLPAVKQAGSVRIFAIGDSNTAGWPGWPGMDPPNWPMYLEQLLRKDSSRFTVTNAGVWGYSSFQGLRRFKEALPLKPDIVLISFGANDAMRHPLSDADFSNQKIRKANVDKILVKARLGQLLLAVVDKLTLTGKDRLVARVDLEEYRANLAEMVRLSNERGIKPVLLTRPFIEASSDRWWIRNFLPAYNATTIEVARRTGVRAIDIYEHFKDEARYFSDESHFTEEGYRRMARIVYEGIVDLLQ